MTISKDFGNIVYGEVGLCEEISINLCNKMSIESTTMIYSEFGISLISNGYISIGYLSYYL